MKRILFGVAFFSCFFSLSAQEVSLKFQERNPKFHRFRSLSSSQRLRANLMANPQPLDTVAIEDLFPSLSPEEAYASFRKNYDVVLRQSAHSWRYKNHKHRKSAQAYIKFRLVPNANRLTYPKDKKRQSLF